MRRTVLCGRTFAGLMAVTAAERGGGGLLGGVGTVPLHGNSGDRTEEAELHSLTPSSFNADIYCIQPGFPKSLYYLTRR